jgi:hypothetical protein
MTGVADLARQAGALAQVAPPSGALTVETFQALVAFVVPGPDAFSRAQGESHPLPGGVDAGAAPALIATLNGYDPPTPAASLLAGFLTRAALEIAPLASRGGFAAPFARLSSAEKAQVFDRLERDPTIAGSRIAFAILLLPALAATHAYGEAPVLDTATRTLRARPVGWELTGYDVSDGSDELLGYWQGRTSSSTSPEWAA